MIGRGCTRTATQHPLPTHEFAIVFAQRAGQRTKAGITHVRAGSPFPDIAKQLLYAVIRTGSNRSEEHTSELQSLMRISYACFCLKKKNKRSTTKHNHIRTPHTNILTS